MSERIVHGMSEADYHATPALSAGGAWALANDCPAIYWHTSPFNPSAASFETGKIMDVGTAVHLAALEPDRLQERTVIVDADDWRTKAAKEARDVAYDTGRVPLLLKDIDLVNRLAAALRANEHAAKLLDGAATEVSYFWRSDDGVDCKARADIITRDGAIADLKASASASPQFFQRQAMNAGHFLRAPFYMDGWNVLGGNARDYFFIVVAREEPNLITVCKLDEQALEWGRMHIRRAMTIFKQCRKHGLWPAYCEAPVTLGLPDWAHYRLADQEQEGRFDPAKITRADVRRGFDFLAP